MAKVEMTAHVIVSSTGEWTIYGWSGREGERHLGNRGELFDRQLWEHDTDDKFMDIKFTVDVPDKPPVVELQVTKCP